MNLEAEARYLHQQLFDTPPCEHTIQAYQRAHLQISALAHPQIDQLRTVSLIVKHHLDANGIEFFLRTGPSHHLLGKKLLLLAYLHQASAEEPIHSTCKTWLFMFASLAVGAYSVLRGYFQKRRYGLI